MKHEQTNGAEPAGRTVKLPAIGTIKAEDLNPALAAVMRAKLDEIFAGLEPGPIHFPDTLQIPVMDVIQAWRYFAQEFVFAVESLNLPIEKARHMIGHVVGAIYRAEQPLLAQLGLENDL